MRTECPRLHYPPLPRPTPSTAAKTRERMEEKEREGNDQEAVNKMRHGIARLQAYRSFIEKMN